MNLLNSKSFIILLLIILPVLIIFFTRYMFRQAVNIAINDFIIPSLQSNGLIFIDFTLLKNQFIGINKERADWEHIQKLKMFDDTNFNRKLFGKLTYKNGKKETCSTTVKIGLNMNSKPVSVSFYPELTCV